jgi:LmbE family N-acetylglucosaminyl deacetylase
MHPRGNASGVAAMLPPAMTHESVLAVGAHPDDCEFYAGGTLAALARDGARVTVVVCTDGAVGGSEGGPELAARRRGEAERACAELGAAEVVFLGHPDGGLQADDRLIGDLVGAIRKARPTLVLGHDPSMLWTRVGERYHLGHTDHQAAGRGVLAAVYPRAALPTYFPDQIASGLAPWWVREIWLFDTNEPDYYHDIRTTEAAKHAALAHHDSQNPNGMLVKASVRRAKDSVSRHGVVSEPFRKMPLGM